MFDFALENVTRPHKGLTRYMHVHSDCATCRRDMGSQLFGIDLVQDNQHVLQIWTKPYGGKTGKARVCSTTLDGWIDCFCDGNLISRAPLSRDFRPQLALAVKHLESCCL
jgi:hypothetical protein